VKPVLSTVAFISGLYDAVVGAFLLVAADSLAVLFGVPPASPRIFSDLNGLFLLAVGAGYYLPWRDPIRYRGYMWVMGPLLKGGGAALFLLDYFLRGSPASFLLFAASDGTLAVVTWWALRADPVASAFSRKTAAGAELPPGGGSHG
jgi:hypothetical protein